MNNKHVFIEKLRSAGLRPTKQRLAICKVLFDRKETFHFTIEELQKIIKKEGIKNVSLATLYNTVNSFKEKGIIQPIIVRNSNNDRTKFEIIAGERRWQAAQSAGLHEVPVVIIEADNLKKKLPE